MKFWALLLGPALLCGCRLAVDYVKIADTGEYEAEKAFLESLFEDNAAFESLGIRLVPDSQAAGEQKTRIPPPALFIDWYSSWEYEAAFGDIPVSRVPLVPREDALAGRTTTTLAACLENQEDLVPLDKLAPPFVALRVDGHALGDGDYPLIRAVGIRVRGEQDKPLKPRIEKKLRLLEEFLEAAPKPLIQTVPSPVWLVSGGDLMLDRGAAEVLFKEGPVGIFGGTAEMLAAADIALVNLEGVVSSRGTKVKKSFNFRFSPETAPALRGAGIDAVLHANNHVYDYGGEAFLDSLHWLGQAGIGVVGAGLNDEAAAEPFVFRRGEEVFQIFGLASFPRERNGWDGVSAAAGPNRAGMLHAGRGGGEKLKSRFSPEGSPGVVNIVLFHGGVEWSRRPDQATRELYTGLIRAGADLVIGSHPHTVQGFEWVLGKPVFWSLGNYVFGGMENTEGGEEGLFIRLGLLGSTLVYLEPFPLSLSHIRTDIAPAAKLGRFYTLSKELREQSPPLEP